MRLSLRLMFLFCGVLLMAAQPSIAWSPSAPAKLGKGYVVYEIGDATAATPGKVQPGLMLVGGGDWPVDAFRWMAQRAGNGHLVILRASGDTEAQDEWFHDVGGIASARTFVFRDRAAASDPEVLAAVRSADGIFLAGGDQSNYVRYWKGTPLNEAIDAHVRQGKPIGGTSAGLAILGAYAYGAMDGGSIDSATAMGQPLGPEVTLVEGFLHMPYLERVITDSHFGKRERLGRLIAFVANLRQGGHADVVGLGVDEQTAVCIDGEGRARVFSANGGSAWLVQPEGPPKRARTGKSLDYRAVKVTGVGVDSTLTFPALAVERPSFERLAQVVDGKLDVRDVAGSGVAGNPGDRAR